MRALMLVSANAGSELRREVKDGARPIPEFIALERDYGVKLLDWSSLKLAPGRSAGNALRHAAAGLHAAEHADVVFSDGEHVGIPLGVGLSTLGPSRPHVTIGHHLTSRSKPRMLRLLRHMGISRVLVHSRAQLRAAVDMLGFDDRSAALVPFFADACFWRPQPIDSEPLVIAAGREHRDYTTFAAAMAGIDARGVITGGSTSSPNARCLMPAELPANVSIAMQTPRSLRDLYSRAQVVVVPLIPSDFPAGITAILEAMAMAKAVVVTATEGQSDVVIDGETGVMVPAFDGWRLRSEVQRLLANPRERRRLGANARDSVLERYDLPTYAAALYQHLYESAHQVRRAA